MITDKALMKPLLDQLNQGVLELHIFLVSDLCIDI